MLNFGAKFEEAYDDIEKKEEDRKYLSMKNPAKNLA